MAKVGSEKSTTSAQPKDNSKYLKTSDDTALEGHVATLGQMGCGKSVFAATGSAFCPDELPAKKKTDLPDMLWFSFDRGGTAGFPSLKINVPHVIDARALIADKGVESGTEEMLRLAAEIVAKEKVERAVLDTVSKLDAVMLAHYMTKFQNDSNKHAVWNALLARYRRVYEGIDKLGLQMISNFHTKAKLTDNSLDQGKARASMAMPSEESDLMFDISGQARKIFLSDASLKGALYATVSKKHGTVRTYYPFGGKSMEGGCRYQELLDDEEPAHLGKIFRKIKAGLK